MSQIDMVVFLRDHSHLRVCGDFKAEEGRLSRRPEVHVVVRQGDTVAKGQGAVDEDLRLWRVEVAADQEAQFTDTEPAIACGVIIVEKEPGGLESLSWVQQVEIRKGEEDQGRRPIEFPPREPVASPEGGQLPDGRAVSSSLTILKESNPQGGDMLTWRREVSIRPVELAKVLEGS